MRDFMTGCRRAPTMAALLLFASIATVLQYSSPTSVKEAFIPYTGWAGLAMPYSFLLFFLAYALGTSDSPTRHRMRLACLGLLALAAACGVAEWLFLGGPRASTNPYLRISSWRPVWTVLVPLVWLGILYRTRPRTESQLPSHA